MVRFGHEIKPKLTKGKEGRKGRTRGKLCKFSVSGRVAVGSFLGYVGCLFHSSRTERAEKGGMKTLGERRRMVVAGMSPRQTAERAR